MAGQLWGPLTANWLCNNHGLIQEDTWKLCNILGDKDLADEWKAAALAVHPLVDYDPNDVDQFVDLAFEHSQHPTCYSLWQKQGSVGCKARISQEMYIAFVADSLRTDQAVLEENEKALLKIPVYQWPSALAALAINRCANDPESKQEALELLMRAGAPVPKKRQTIGDPEFNDYAILLQACKLPIGNMQFSTAWCLVWTLTKKNKRHICKMRAGTGKSRIAAMTALIFLTNFLGNVHFVFTMSHLCKRDK